jgi:hypothetical protein
MGPGTRTLIWAIGGLALAVALSLTAFAVAGGPISQPAGSVHVVETDNSNPPQTPSPSHSARPTKTPEPTKSATSSTSTPTSSTAQPTPTDDHGGGSHDGDDD